MIFPVWQMKLLSCTKTNGILKYQNPFAWLKNEKTILFQEADKIFIDYTLRINMILSRISEGRSLL